MYALIAVLIIHIFVVITEKLCLSGKSKDLIFNISPTCSSLANIFEVPVNNIYVKNFTLNTKLELRKHRINLKRGNFSCRPNHSLWLALFASWPKQFVFKIIDNIYSVICIFSKKDIIYPKNTEVIETIPSYSKFDNYRYFMVPYMIWLDKFDIALNMVPNDQVTLSEFQVEFPILPHQGIPFKIYDQCATPNMDNIFKQSFLPSSTYKKGQQDRSSLEFIGDILKNIEANLPEEHLKRRDHSEVCGFSDFISTDNTFSTKMKPRIVQAVSASVDCISRTLLHPYREEYGRGSLMVQNLSSFTYVAGCPAIVGNDMNCELFGFPVFQPNSTVTSPSTWAYPFHSGYIEPSSELFYMQNDVHNSESNILTAKHKLNPEAAEFIPLAVLSQNNNVKPPQSNIFENKTLTGNSSKPTSDFGFIKNDIVEDSSEEYLPNSNLQNKIFVEKASQVIYFADQSGVLAISKSAPVKESVFNLTTGDMEIQEHNKSLKENYFDKNIYESNIHSCLPVDMSGMLGKSLVLDFDPNSQENTNKLNSNLIENSNKLVTDSQENAINILNSTLQENSNKFNSTLQGNMKNEFNSNLQENINKVYSDLDAMNIVNSNLHENTNKLVSNLQEITINNFDMNLQVNSNKFEFDLQENPKNIFCSDSQENSTNLLESTTNEIDLNLQEKNNANLPCTIDVCPQVDEEDNLSDIDYEESSDDSSSSEEDSELSDEDECATETKSDESFINFGSVDSTDSNFIFNCTASEATNPNSTKLIGATTGNIFSLICHPESDSEEEEDSDYDCDLFTVQLDDGWDFCGGGLQISAIISPCSPENFKQNIVKAEDYNLIVNECCEYLDEPSINIVSINERWKGEMEKINNIRSPAKVKFNDNVEIHPTVMWDRKGLWEQYARDRMRFSRRIEESEGVLASVLAPEHRQKVLQKIIAESGTNK